MRIVRKVIKVAPIIGVSVILAACTKHVTVSLGADVGYVNAKQLPSNDSSINKIRLQALREAATSLGAQGALAWRAQHIDAALEKQASYLDHVFDFNQLLLNNNVLPPIVVESNNNLTLANNETIRSANKTYKLIASARFVTAPPTWRDYLWMPFKAPTLPNKSLLPTTKQEAVVWNQFLKEGWKEGLTQANDIFAANLNRLKRDYTGMVLYRKLVDQKIITTPQVSKASLGVTGNSKELRIGDEISRITVQSALQPNSQKWNPVLTN